MDPQSTPDLLFPAEAFERRKAPRRPLERACKLLVERKAKLMRASTLDLSDGGARLSVDERWAPALHESVALWIDRPELGIQRQHSAIRGRVVRHEGEVVCVEFEHEMTGLVSSVSGGKLAA